MRCDAPLVITITVDVRRMHNMPLRKLYASIYLHPLPDVFLCFSRYPRKCVFVYVYFAVWLYRGVTLRTAIADPLASPRPPFTKSRLFEHQFVCLPRPHQIRRRSSTISNYRSDPKWERDLTTGDSMSRGGKHSAYICIWCRVHSCTFELRIAHQHTHTHSSRHRLVCAVWFRK